MTRYRIGDLALKQMVEIQTHLETCTRCREILEGMSRQRQEFLAKHPADEVVPELMKRARAGWLRRLWRRLREMSYRRGTMRHPKKTEAKAPKNKGG